jgi:fibronectin type 3 domain-containing protein
MSKIKLPLLSLLMSGIFFQSIWAQGPKIDLSWDAPADPQLSHYIIYRDTLSGTRLPFDTTSGKVENYTDTTVQPGKTYYYKISAVNQNGQESLLTKEVSATIGMISLISQTGKTATISGSISFIIHKPGQVHVSIFNWEGQKVWERDSTYEVIGKHLVEWDGRDGDGKRVLTGRYYYQVTYDNGP